MQRNLVRIIAGAWRRRLLRFPDAADLRPTPDRVRETLFNWLGQSLEGLACLDLFAGSGALGFEAASRGARTVTMVERDPQVFRALQENCKLLGAGQVELVCADAFAFLQGDRRRFDVVFLDPPYRLSLLARLLDALPGHLADAARIYVEGDADPENLKRYKLLRSAKAGAVQYLLVQWSAHENPP